MLILQFGILPVNKIAKIIFYVFIINIALSKTEKNENRVIQPT